MMAMTTSSSMSVKPVDRRRRRRRIMCDEPPERRGEITTLDNARGHPPCQDRPGTEAPPEPWAMAKHGTRSSNVLEPGWGNPGLKDAEIVPQRGWSGYKKPTCRK